MKLFELEKNGYNVEFIDLEYAGFPKDICLIRVVDKDGEVVDEAFLTMNSKGILRKESAE